MPSVLSFEIECRPAELVVRLGADHQAAELHACLSALLAEPGDLPLRVELPAGGMRHPGVRDAVAAGRRAAAVHGRSLHIDAAPAPRTWHSPLLDEDRPVPARTARGKAAAVALVLAAALAAVAAPPSEAAADAQLARSSCAHADVVPGDPALAAWSTRCLINGVRAAEGLRPFLRDDALGTTAGRYASRLVGERFFAHRAPDGEELADRLASVTRSRGPGFAIGEALRWGTGRLATPREAVRGWLGSPPHRALVLDRRTTRFGIGVLAGSPRGHRGPAATYVLHVGAWGLDRRAQPRAARRAS